MTLTFDQEIVAVLMVDKNPEKYGALAKKFLIEDR